MRIIHTSDWHLGQFFYGKSRALEHQKFLTWLLEQVQLHDINAVVVAGDVFDTGTPPSYAREMYFDFIVEMRKLHCQLFVLAGNHDSASMLLESKQLAASLSTCVVANVNEDIAEQVFTLKNKQGEDAAILCAVPFIRPRDITVSKSGQSSGQKQLQLQQAINNHYQALYQYAKNLNSDLPVVATGHLTALGVKTSDSVRDIYIGTLEAFPASEFPSFDYIALGHIHKPQIVAKQEQIRYCGSPIPLSFDEAKQQKQVLMVELKQREAITVTALDVPCFQPLVMLKSNIESLAEEIAQVADKYKDEDKVWLDIEIESGDYLQDLQPRIAELVDGSNIEVLLVRRSKKARQAMPEQQKKVTLNELTINDVFTERLAQEEWPDEQEQQQKNRLEQLFVKIHQDVLSEDPLTPNENIESADI